MELVIEGKTQGLKWSAAHVIPNHPKCGRLHGHDYTLDIKVLIPESVINMKMLSVKGYILDYGDIKKVAKKYIEDMDHRFIIPMGLNSNVFIDRSQGKITYMNITVPENYTFSLPHYDVVSSENLSLYFKNKMMEEFPEYVIYCKVNEGEGQGVWL